MIRLHRLYGLLAALGAGLALSASALAQADSCAAFVRAALAGAFLECASVAPGQVCYGGSPVRVQGEIAGRFGRPGRIAEAGAVETLRAGAPSLSSSQWGIALIRTAGALPGSDALLVALGGVTLANDGGSEIVRAAQVRVAFAGGANARAQPAEDAAVVAQLQSGATLPATGILPDGTWLRLHLPSDAAGWVRADLLRGHFDALPTINPGDPAPAALTAPFTALTLQADNSAPPCSAAPDAGVLVQTDNPVGFTINGAAVQVAGTAFITTQTNGALLAAALEGYVIVSAGGGTETATAGLQVRLRRGADAAPGAPRPPEPYPYARARALPLSLLPRPVAEPAFNALGVITPAAPGVNPLDGVNAASTCTVAAFNDEGRLRAGPGREFPILGGLRAGEAATPDARAAGSDGMLWWRLSEGIWVRSDVVLAAGSCGALPLIDAPGLPTPTPSGEWY